jgi:hypothetical protein
VTKKKENKKNNKNAADGDKPQTAVERANELASKHIIHYFVREFVYSCVN